MILTSKYCDSGRGIHQELTSVEYFEKYLSRYLRNRYMVKTTRTHSVCIPIIFFFIPLLIENYDIDVIVCVIRVSVVIRRLW